MKAEQDRGRGPGPRAQGARSETQRLLREMRPGEAWSHEAAARNYRAGGNQGDSTDGTPDSEAEEGYPTPS